MKNLFDEKVAGHTATTGNGIFQRRKRSMNYRRSTDLMVRCKWCIHRISGRHHDKYYHKCKLIGLSHSEATDIRMSGVCDKFEK